MLRESRISGRLLFLPITFEYTFNLNFSGKCLYLSQSNDYKWRDTSCLREKGILCERNSKCEAVSVDHDRDFGVDSFNPIDDEDNGTVTYCTVK